MEVLLVLTIISILMGVLRVSLSNRKLQAETKNLVECFKIYESAIQMYYYNNGGVYPADIHEKHLESIDALKAYCPRGFVTTNIIKTKQCTALQYYNPTENEVGVQASIEDETLRNAVIAQLKQLSVPSMVSNTGTQIIYYQKYIVNTP